MNSDMEILMLQSMALSSTDREYCLYLLNKIKNTKDYGDHDMILCRLESFIKERYESGKPA